MAANLALVHGARLLEKDVRLLGDVLGEVTGDNLHYRSMRNTAAGFLDLALTQ